MLLKDENMDPSRGSLTRRAAYRHRAPPRMAAGRGSACAESLSDSRPSPLMGPVMLVLSVGRGRWSTPAKQRVCSLSWLLPRPHVRSDAQRGGVPALIARWPRRFSRRPVHDLRVAAAKRPLPPPPNSEYGQLAIGVGRESGRP
jgi:hypothetical protein